MKRVAKCKARIEQLYNLKDPQLSLLLQRPCLSMMKCPYCWRTIPRDVLSQPAKVMTKAFQSGCIAMVCREQCAPF
jgi:hypothetical protein